MPAGALNGSGEYLPPLAALMVVGLSVRAIDQRRLILSAGAIFTCSLFLRMIDREACALLPLGTHFLWHLLNAVVLYLLLRSAIATPHSHPVVEPGHAVIGLLGGAAVQRHVAQFGRDAARRDRTRHRRAP